MSGERHHKRKFADDIGRTHSPIIQTDLNEQTFVADTYVPLLLCVLLFKRYILGRYNNWSVHGLSDNL